MGRHASWPADPGPDAYIPFLQAPRTSVTLFVSTATAPPDLLPALRSTVWNIDANLPLTDVRTMEERVANASARTRLTRPAGVIPRVRAPGCKAPVLQCIHE